jgi:hypothetical protein
VPLAAAVASTRCAISSSDSFEPRPNSSIALRYRLRVAKSMAAKSGEVFSASSTRLTLSKNSAQSTSDISRMLVMMLRTVTFEAPWRRCSS